jgi:hypothetical protein
MVRLSEREKKERDAKELKEQWAREEREQAEQERQAAERERQEREDTEKAERERRALLSVLFCALEPPFVGPASPSVKKGKKKKVQLDAPHGPVTPTGRYRAPKARETPSAASSQDAKGVNSQSPSPQKGSKIKPTSPQAPREALSATSSARKTPSSARTQPSPQALPGKATTKSTKATSSQNKSTKRTPLPRYADRTPSAGLCGWEVEQTPADGAANDAIFLQASAAESTQKVIRQVLDDVIVSLFPPSPPPSPPPSQKTLNSSTCISLPLKENSGEVKDGKGGRGMPGGGATGRSRGGGGRMETEIAISATLRKKRADSMMEEAEARLRWVRERGATGTVTSVRYTDPDMVNYFMYSDDVYPAFEADGYYVSKVLYEVTLYMQIYWGIES